MSKPGDNDDSDSPDERTVVRSHSALDDVFDSHTVVNFNVNNLKVPAAPPREPKFTLPEPPAAKKSEPEAEFNIIRPDTLTPVATPAPVPLPPPAVKPLPPSAPMSVSLPKSIPPAPAPAPVVKKAEPLRLELAKEKIEKLEKSEKSATKKRIVEDDGVGEISLDDQELTLEPRESKTKKRSRRMQFALPALLKTPRFILALGITFALLAIMMRFTSSSTSEEAESSAALPVAAVAATDDETSAAPAARVESRRASGQQNNSSLVGVDTIIGQFDRAFANTQGLAVDRDN